MWWLKKILNKKKKLIEFRSSELCSHKNSHIFFDKDPLKNPKTFDDNYRHLDFKLCYCKECGKKYAINYHYITIEGIVSEILEGEWLDELDRKLVFPLRDKKLKRILKNL